MLKMQELREQLRKQLGDARAIADAAEKEGRDFTGEEREKVAKILAEAKGTKDELAKLEGDEEIKKAILEMGAGLVEKQETGKQAAVNAGKGRTIGEQFVNSPEIKAWMGQFPGGRVPDRMRVQSPPVEFKRLFGQKTLITGADDTSAGAFVQTDYTGIYEPIGRFPLTVRDLINIRQTTSDLVEFVRQTAQITQAATVAEANVTTYSGATGEVSGEKPEATMTFEKVQAAVKTIAAWIPATKRALSDAAQIRGIIDQELQDDIAEELENQIINGDGLGENFTGILNTAGVLLQAWDTNIFTTTRKAKTTLLSTGRSRPTAYLLNPADWETIELTQDLAGRYYYGGPIANGQKALWGVPVVECQSLAEGQIILGDFRKAVMWDRERATISVSDSHEDFFIRNMVAILCEMRAAFGLVRPSGFVIIDATAGS